MRQTGDLRWRVRLRWTAQLQNGAVTTQVLLVPTNPLDLRPEDLESLVERIGCGHASSVGVGVVSQRGYGVTWWEVLVVYVATKGIDAVVGRMHELLLNVITDTVKDWYHERRQARGDKRPLSLTIRDDDGHVLRAIELKASGEVEDVTQREREKPVRPRPDDSDDVNGDDEAE